MSSEYETAINRVHEQLVREFHGKIADAETMLEKYLWTTHGDGVMKHSVPVALFDEARILHIQTQLRTRAEQAVSRALADDLAAKAIALLA